LFPVLQELKLLYFLNPGAVMQRILFFFFCSFHTLVFAQRVEDDWENYIVSLNGKPVSINLNLAFESSKISRKIILLSSFIG